MITHDIKTMSAMFFLELSIRSEYQEVQMRMGWLAGEPAVLPKVNRSFFLPVVFSLQFFAGRSYDTGKICAVQIFNMLFKSRGFTQVSKSKETPKSFMPMCRGVTTENLKCVF
jgi:hypothetical protein